MANNASSALEIPSSFSSSMTASRTELATLSFPFHLPVFIKPLPAKLTAQDIHYLHVKGALDIPPLNLRRGLIRSYVRYVHPFLPVLDLRNLVQCTCETFSTGPAPISILVFQAVMFAGLPFLELDKVKELGFSTKREARRVFHNRARVSESPAVDIKQVLKLIHTDSCFMILTRKLTSLLFCRPYFF